MSVKQAEHTDSYNGAWGNESSELHVETFANLYAGNT